MTMSKKLVFFGTEAFSVPTLTALIAAGYEVVAIVTKPDSRKGRGNKKFVHPIKQIGLDHKIPVLQPSRLADINDELAALRPDAGVLVSYGKIIPRRTIELFEPTGIINLHPSLLPRYRGPSPIEATILAGDAHTALSIMKLDEGMDTGPVFVQQAVPLTGQETKISLSEQLAERGAQFLVTSLPSILTGTLTAKPQDNNDVSITSLVSKVDGVLDPATETAETIERKVRAYLGYPKTRLTLNGIDVIVTSSSVVDSSDTEGLVVPCAQHTYIKISTLIAPSGRTMSGADFLRGYATAQT